MKYDPQQRPTASQTLQYPYFQVNSAIQPPIVTDDTPPSTFTRRPVMKTEHELRIEQAATERLVSYCAQLGVTTSFRFILIILLYLYFIP